MFRKIESYVTPILLSHVDKYIKDFKAEDTQVSLWNGAVALHNLELRPNIIQEEFHLPFYLTSGHIHELLIQVPWMKIMSEPILVTINTIECVLTLKTEASSELRNVDNKKNRDELDAPPGYVQSLVNRIVNNISFRCNNLILKYVEEDIVVSVNIKHLYLDSVNGTWEPTFSDMTIDDLHIRKLIRLSDLTLCLDKRNAAGKIETFLEPLLYRCELQIRMDSTYSSLLQKNPLYIRCYLSSPKLEISISYQQIPMLIRLYALFWALKKKHLKISQKTEGSKDLGNHPALVSIHNLERTDSEVTKYEDTWSGWAWSFMQPIYSSEEEDSSSSKNEPVFLVGVNLKNVTMTFKIPEYSNDASATLGNRKVRQRSLARMLFTSVLVEISSRVQRLCFRGGLKKIVFFPENSCACGVVDGQTPENEYSKKYIESTTDIDDYDDTSWPIEYNNETKVETMTESEMMSVCPAISLCYMYTLTLPEDFEDSQSEISSDLEYSNFKESASLKIVIGPVKYFISAGLMHRLSIIQSSASIYDYAPYFVPKPLLKKHELPPPTTDDYEAMMEFISKSTINIYVDKPKVSVAVWDHPRIKEHFSDSFDVPSTGVSTHRRKISSSQETSAQYYKSIQKIPCILFEAESMQLSVTKPMYPNRLTYVICQLPDPPPTMFEACHEHYNLRFNTLQCSLYRHSDSKSHDKDVFGKESENKCKTQSKNKELYSSLITECTFDFIAKKIVLPEYWDHNLSVIIYDYSFNMDNLSLCGTKSKILVVYNILLGAMPSNSSDAVQLLLSSSLLADVICDEATGHFELTLEGLSLRKIHLINTETYRMILNSIKAFIIKPQNDKSRAENVWIVCAPDSSKLISGPFIKAVLQLSTDTSYISFFTMKMEECTLVLDPLLCEFLTYQYKINNEHVKCTTEQHERSPTPINSTTERTQKRSLDDIMNRPSSSKVTNKYTSLHSQSDREKDFIHGATPTLSASLNVDQMPRTLSKKPEECTFKTHFLAMKIFDWRYIVVDIECESFSVYFPVNPMSAINCQTVQEAVKNHVLADDYEGMEKTLVLRLPSTSIKSSALKQNLLLYCVHGFPSKVPSSVWDPGMITYPWKISLKNCSSLTLSKYLMENVHERCILKPVSTDMIVSFSMKLGKDRLSESFTSQTFKKVELTSQKDKNNIKKIKNEVVSKDVPKSSQLDECNVTESISVSSINIKEDKSSEFDTCSSRELSSLGNCIHIDIGLVVISVNRNQISTLTSVIHGCNELSEAVTRVSKPCVCFNENHDIPVNVGSDKSFTQDTQSALNNSKDYKAFSCNDSGITEDTDKTGTNDVSFPQCHNISLTSWIQCTVSRITLKCYAYKMSGLEPCNSSLFIDEYASSNLKLVFDAEDIMTSLDMHPEYVKLKSKMVTAQLQHFKRKSLKSNWKLGKYNGIVMRCREADDLLKQNEENCFLFVTLTLARCSSVHNRWSESGKKIVKNVDNTSGEFIWEIEVCVQSLDLILSPTCLEPFLKALSPALGPISCHRTSKQNRKLQKSNSASITNAEYWNAQKFPLFYFEGHHIRLMIPTVATKNCNLNQDALIIQVNKTSILPVAENPICRHAIRADLYELAAREGWLGLPGGPLEDRQAQLFLRGISVQTAKWGDIAKIYIMEMSEPDPVNVNPALRWNNLKCNPATSITEQLRPILQNLDICVVLAMAMFHKSTLVCGPSVDVNILTDTDIFLSTSQLRLLSMLMWEFSSIAKKFKDEQEFNLESCALKEIMQSCPYSPFIVKHACQEIFKDHKTMICGSEQIQKPISSSVSDKTSTVTFRDSPMSPMNIKSDKILRKACTEYFDIIVTLGKISFLLFDDEATYQKRKMSGKRKQSNEVLSKPLLHIMLHQPNLFMSLSNGVSLMQVSVFSAHVALGGDGSISANSIPSKEFYPLSLMETKPGMLDPATGIPPALFVGKYENHSGSKSSIKLSVNCPVRFTASVRRLKKLVQLHKLLMFNVSNSSITLCTEELVESDTVFTQESPQVFATQSKKSFKKFFGALNSIDISIKQTVLAIEMEKGSQNECLLSFSSLKSQNKVNSRLEKVTSVGLIDAIVLSIGQGEGMPRKIIINPWSIGFEFSASWEPWRMDAAAYSPLIQLLLETDRLIIQTGIKQMQILKEFIDFWTQNLVHELSTPRNSEVNSVLKGEANRIVENNNFWSEASLNDQHYKDDLRAGAFKYVNMVNDTIPLPYQVIIGQRHMAWCYPHPRALTRLCSYPLPFQLESGIKVDSVVCILEYYSEIMGCFMYYTKFYIRQDQSVKLDLPINDQIMVLASIWRIVMKAPNEEPEGNFQSQGDFFDKSKFLKSNRSYNEATLKSEANCPQNLPVTPKMLAGSLRVDSYSAPNALPHLQVILKVLSIELNFYNHSELMSKFTFADKDGMFKMDGNLPPPHVFLNVSLSKLNLQSCMWNKNTGLMKINTNLTCDILDGNDLSLSRALWCRELCGSLWYGGKSSTGQSTGVSLNINKAGVKFGPHVLNTFNVALMQSDTSKKDNLNCEECSDTLQTKALVHRYVLMNDTGVSLRVGQEGTDEGILLNPRSACLYAWHSRKHPRHLTIAVQDGDWQCSNGFQIDVCGNQRCHLVSEPSLPDVGAIISVKPLGSWHRMITIFAQVTLYNILDENIEVKVYQRKCVQKPMASPPFLVKANTQFPSLFLGSDCDSTIRIRFPDSSAGWSGDIPLKECPKGSLPWLVKVPIKSHVEYVSLWCRVISEADTGRFLIVISPLFSIRSHFPMPIELTVVSEASRIPIQCCALGKGSIQKLKLPGTTVTNHTLIFASTDDANKKEVNLVYNQEKVQQEKFDIDTTISNIKQCQEEFIRWPYISNEDDEFVCSPLHHTYPEEMIVSFNYDKPSIDSIIIEINPWTIFCNCSGMNLIVLDDKKHTMCVLQHQSLSTPPMSSLNPHFFISLSENIDDNKISGPLSISTENSEPCDDETTIINMTKSVLIHCETSNSVLSVAHEISNTINIFRFSCNYIVVNRTSYELLVFPQTILTESKDELELPSNIENMCFLLPCNPKSSSGVPITIFHLTNKHHSEDSITDKRKKFEYHIWIGSSPSHTSFICPLRIDQLSIRRSFSLKCGSDSIPIIVSCKTDKDQTYVIISPDEKPQLVIYNNADITIAVGQALMSLEHNEQEEKVVKESERSQWHLHVKSGEKNYYTMPTLSQHFPELVVDSSYNTTSLTTHILFACVKEDNSYDWSSPVNVSCTSSEQFVKLPGYAKDVKVSVNYHNHSTSVTIDNVTQVDISAGEIRSRLSGSISLNRVVEVAEDAPDDSNSSNNSILDISQIFSKKDREGNIVQSKQLDGNMASVEILQNNSRKSSVLLYNEKVEQNSSSSLLEMFAKSLVVFKINYLNLTLNADDQVSGEFVGDIASLTCHDTILTSILSDKGSTITLTSREIQLDNPMHLNGEFDFPVVLVCQSSMESDDKCPTVMLPTHFKTELEEVNFIRKNSMIMCKVELEVWEQSQKILSGINELTVSTGPLSVYIEDTYITAFINYVSKFAPSSEHLCIWKSKSNQNSEIITVAVSKDVLSEVALSVKPIQLGVLRIKPLDILLSLHTNLHMYIAVDHSPLQLSAFERTNIMTTSFRLGHALTMHYLSEVMYRAGWVVGSLEILGCPGGLARRVGAGLRALLAEPCRGLMGRGPWGFLVGVTYGSATLLRHLTQGTVESVSMVMGSVARNLDRLSLDEDHVRRMEVARRLRPRGLPQGLALGLKSLALGVFGGAAGLLGQPLRRGAAAGLATGILGAVAKPLGATADLLAFTSQGLLGQVGWDPQPQAVWRGAETSGGEWWGEEQSWRLRLGHSLPSEALLHICHAVDRDTSQPVALIITNKWLLLMDLTREKVQHMVEIGSCTILEEGPDLCIALHNTLPREDNQMEEVSAARVAAYVGEPIASRRNEYLLRLKLSPMHSSHTVTVLTAARQHHLGYGFQVL